MTSKPTGDGVPSALGGEARGTADGRSPGAAVRTRRAAAVVPCGDVVVFALQREKNTRTPDITEGKKDKNNLLN